MPNTNCTVRSIRGGIAAFVLLIITAGTALAADGFGSVDRGILDAELVDHGWNLLEKRGVPATRFSLSGADELHIETASSNALIYRLVGELSPDVQAQPVLTWTWRTDRLANWVTPESFANPDWPIAIYAFFAVDKQFVGFWQRMLNRLRFGAAGLPSAGKFVTYVWAVDEPPASPYPNPYLPDSGAIYVLRQSAAAMQKWHTERRDLRADFEAAFGHPAGELLYLAVSADSEEAGGNSVVRVRQLQVE